MEYALLTDCIKPDSKAKPSYFAPVKLYRNAENDLLKPYAPAQMAYRLPT
jgi:hypothetical protein